MAKGRVCHRLLFYFNLYLLNKSRVPAHPILGACSRVRFAVYSLIHPYF